MSDCGIVVGRKVNGYAVHATDGLALWTYGAEEIAPDGTRHNLCRCDHDTREKAIACGIQRCTPELARMAFEAYGQSTGGKTWDGKDIPPFDVIRERTPHVARAWEAAVSAVRKAVGF